MKVLLAEYTMLRDPHLAPEGAAMFHALRTSFERAGHQVMTPENGDFGDEIRRLAPLCDAGLIIAPDHLLAGFTRLLEQATWNIGCGSLNVAVCANKQMTSSILASNGIDVPGAPGASKNIVKPVSGCGSQGVRVTSEAAGPGEISQEFIEGDHLSVSLVGSRVVGDVCECYSGKPPLVLAINRQEIGIGDDGRVSYHGGVTPVKDHPMGDRIIGAAIKAVTVLGCQGYTGVDIVAGDRVVVVDVNPRITTSVVGIIQTMDEELSDILIEASFGRGPVEVHHHGTARFDETGRVTADDRD
jgi:predicted ATP-grasp superfamily ATP-dependent carboligase